ncbi:MAG TPA: glycosyltransferase family protein [Sedimentisphaerales bacterium]|jgi:UDP:flavonoid glycosyltransferase YjiC (YdhE family)|nr:glycosyltransferase family protein [Sedimentisphaerales bacterium]HNU31785.1 glycosyltransferase family protein [Sedimentisphaerales bacterium]
MARILYGVAGQGFGHSSRSHLIGQHLIDAGHDVLFAASRQSFSYLRRHFGEKVKEIAGLSLVYRNGQLLPVKTLSTNLSRVFQNRRTNLELYRKVFEPFSPDLVISDFEPFSAWWAWRHGIPFVSILNTFHDHQFRIHGFNEARRCGNCEFKETSTEGFLQDLASCRGVIATAGFSLLSECLYFRKKGLLLPVQGQYEQIVNARYAEKLGLALNRLSLNVQTLIEYLVPTQA